MAVTFQGRYLDAVFFLFFISHIPITIFIDLQAIYPTWLVPSFLRQALATYVQFTKDPFMGATSSLYWFQSLVSLEGLFQLPFFFVAVYGLYHDKFFVRLPMAVYGSHVVTTVAPILTELALNPNYADLDDRARCILLALYGPYFIIPLIILVDSYRRVSFVLAPKIKSN